jgi:predicted alpha/beta superfamily hydrolase
MIVVRVLVAVLFVVLGAVCQAAPGRPYVLPNTQVFDLHSAQTSADYQIYVATPPGYPESGKRYPVVYVLDADYSFALTRNVIQHFVERKGLPDMILVGIAYPGAATDRKLYKTTRTRDYTPTFVAGDVGYGAEFQKVSGGGPKFKAFLAKELFPFVERTFAADPGDRTIVGHSYGGLLGAYLLVVEPSMFKRYVIVSPSLWYADRGIFQMADAAKVKPSNAHVFLSVGALENPMMSSDLTALYERLKADGAPDLKLTIQIFENERHDSVFPAAVVRGLRTVFESLGPRPETNTP